MQDKKTNPQKNQETKKERKKPSFENLFAIISPSGEEEAGLRLKKAGSGLAYGFLSWMLSGGILFFGTRPLALALLCATENQIFPVFLGILVSVLINKSPTPLLWGALVILIFRVIVSFVPDFHDKKRDSIKALTLDLSSLDDNDHPRLDGEVKKTQFSIKYFLLAIKAFIMRSFYISDREQTPSSQTTNEKNRKYNESLPAKALFGSIGGFVCGLFTLIAGEYAFFDMFGALVLIIGTPILVLAFSPADSQDTLFRGWSHTLSWFAILCLAVYSSASLTVLGIPVTPLAIMLFTLFLTSTRGLVSGTFCGLIFGLIYNPLYAPLLVISALMYAFISPLKKSFALGGICISVVLWCYYFGGTSGLVGTLSPMLIALPIFFTSEKYYSMLFPERTNQTEESSNTMFGKKAKDIAGVYFAEAVSERGKNESMTDKLGALSEAFSSLSQTFNSLVDRFRRPDMLGIKKITEETLEENCKDCRNKDFCWGAGYTQTLEISNKISSALHKKGYVDENDLSLEFSSRCPKANKIIKDINYECEQVTENIIHSQKIGNFASNFDDISAILRDALDGEGDEYECDLVASQKIFDFLVSSHLKVKGVVVCGKRNKRILIKGALTSPGTQAFSGGVLCEKLSEIVGIELMGPIFEMSTEETVMMFYSKPKLSAICSHGRLSADTDEESMYAEILHDDGVFFFKNDSGEEVSPCGDCTRVFVNGNSYFYSLISDGMGSGADAALASEVCSMFVEKMLMAGNRADITVRMLNNFLRSENTSLGRECSATLDLFELDLINGSASFIKSGAAPTYICRENKVYKVNSRTMPVGIIKQADAKLTKFDTRPSDIVVMISDGCCPDSEDCPWLVDYLSKVSAPEANTSPEDLEEFTGNVKNRILSLAIENSPPERHKDDISVSVVLICA